MFHLIGEVVGKREGLETDKGTKYNLLDVLIERTSGAAGLVSVTDYNLIAVKKGDRLNVPVSVAVSVGKNGKGYMNVTTEKEDLDKKGVDAGRGLK